MNGLITRFFPRSSLRMSSELLTIAHSIGTGVVDVCNVVPEPFLDNVFEAFKSVLEMIDKVKSQRAQSASLIQLVAVALLAIDRQLKGDTRRQNGSPEELSSHVEQLEEYVITGTYSEGTNLTSI